MSKKTTKGLKLRGSVVGTGCVVLVVCLGVLLRLLGASTVGSCIAASCVGLFLIKYIEMCKEDE